LNDEQVASNKDGKQVAYPADVKALTTEYNKTESGVFYKVLKVIPLQKWHCKKARVRHLTLPLIFSQEGEGSTPTAGDVVEIQYVGSVCEVDKKGKYDCADQEGLSEIYPTLPQVRHEHMHTPLVSNM
jgi:hypothetical protein